MITIDLGFRLIDCPIYWQNFILALHTNGKYEHDVPMPIIQRELKRYNARYVEIAHTIDYIEFQSDKDLTVFALRWV